MADVSTHEECLLSDPLDGVDMRAVEQRLARTEQRFEDCVYGGSAAPPLPTSSNRRRSRSRREPQASMWAVDDQGQDEDLISLFLVGPFERHRPDALLVRQVT